MMPRLPNRGISLYAASGFAASSARAIDPSDTNRDTARIASRI
ncbi:MAG: hypothetical protein AAB090_00905 [Nitrospirota bacterium]